MGESRVIMAVAEPVARLVLVRLRAPTDSLAPCCRTRGRHPAHRAREYFPWMSTADGLRPRCTAARARLGALFTARNMASPRIPNAAYAPNICE